MMQQLRPTPRETPVIDGLLLTCLQGLRTDHQFKEEECPGAVHRGAPPVITIGDYELDAVCQFTYLSLDAGIDKRIGKAASTLACLTAQVWTSPKLSVNINMAVYNACVSSTLLYGNNTCMDYTCRAGEKALHISPENHPTYPGRILARHSIQRCCPVSCWSAVCTLCLDNADCDRLFRVPSMENCRIPKDTGEENQGPPSPAI